VNRRPRVEVLSIGGLVNIIFEPLFFCRSAYGAGQVPRLSELCVMKLHEHVDSIVDCRGLGFDVLEPILERAKPETLMVIEDYNSYLTEHTGMDLLTDSASFLSSYLRGMGARTVKIMACLNLSLKPVCNELKIGGMTKHANLVNSLIFVRRVFVGSDPV